MDIQILLFLQSIREALGGSLNAFMIFMSSIAVDYFILVPALVIFWTVDKKKGSNVLLTWGSSLFFGAFLKATFCIYRPWIRDPRVTPPPEISAGATGYSFPSGHSVSSGGFWNALAFAYKQYKGFVVFCVVMVGLTMFSRIFLGVHTPQDVLVGCGVSLLCAVGMYYLLNWIEKNPNFDWIIPVAATVICTALLFYLKLKSYPMDYVDDKLLVDPKKMTIDGFKDPGLFYGIVLGWFIERRFVKFDIEGTIVQKVLRALIGGLLAVFWYTAVVAPLGKAVNNSMVYFLTQASTPIVCMVLYPLIFSLIEKNSAKN